jgi:hypothetical protein
MVGYCCAFNHNHADVEELVADAINTHFYEYLEKINIDGEHPHQFAVVRRWLCRRVLLNLGTLRIKRARGVSDGHSSMPEHDDSGDSIVQEKFLDLDTPEALMCLSQRLPPVPQLLVDYAPFDGFSREGNVISKTLDANTANDRIKFHKTKQKFLRDLASGPQPGSRPSKQELYKPT